MTGCLGGPADEFAERYLLGTLTEAESERFEGHYFACSVCHEWLLALKDVQDGLKREPVAIPAPATANVPRRVLTMPMRVIAWGSLAAVLLVGVTIVVNLHRDSQKPAMASIPTTAAPGIASPNSNQTELRARPQVAELEKLADPTLPAYREPQLRGTEDSDPDHVAFAAAMRLYAVGNCAGALPQLARVAGKSADGVAAQLFTGLCQFGQKDWKRAQAGFRSVLQAGETPQRETAEYYLAQTMLELGDAAGARSHLAKTIALHGDYEKKASAQLKQLPRIEPQR